jgi:competence protein ComEC
MDEIALAMIAGMLPLIILPQLPGFYGCLLMAVGVIGGLLINHKLSLLASIILLSMLWGTHNGQYLLKQTESLSLGKKEVIAELKTINLHQSGTQVVTFNIERVNGELLFPPVLFRSHWEGDDGLCAGQKWVLKVNLRPVHAQLNEGGFDSQRWALANHWPLTGRITSSAVISPECSLRQRLITHVQRAISPLDNSAVLVALAFGEKGLIKAEDKLLMQRTGIAHLIAISGLHIGIAAWFGYLLARALQYFLPIKYIDYRFPLIVSEITLLAYTWLAGGNAPAVRAAVALSLWLLLRFMRVKCHPWQIWTWCVALQLINDPMSILSDSFWLSCFAVAALIFWFQWAPLPQGVGRSWRWAVLRWAHLQLGMTILLLPMQVGLFHGINLSSFAANMWAVPIVSLFTVPLVLLGVIGSGVLPHLIAEKLWLMADLSLSLAFWGVKRFSGDWFYLSEPAVAFTFIGWGSLIVWRLGWLSTFPTTILGLATVLMVWFHRAEDEKWRVDMVDVGHGLAILISQNGRGVLYDTGNRWEKGSAAEMNILPLVRWRNIQIEQIIISHAHADHRGGLDAIRQAFPSATLRESVIASPLPCHAGVAWQWQGLSFEALWPEKAGEISGNDESCVVRVSDGSFSVLLTGDIESGAERKIVSRYRDALRATVLQVPHHGSNTSSTPPFLRAVAPELAISSSSRFNKWHLPAKKVMARYRNAKLKWRDTSNSGQLSVHFYDKYWRVNGFREQIFPRWYHRRFGVSGDNE